MHYTDQQYAIDSVSGNVTIEWEGTGPDEVTQVSEFTCAIDGGRRFSCKFDKSMNACVVRVTNDIMFCYHKYPNTVINTKAQYNSNGSVLCMYMHSSIPNILLQ